jgi:hypothetical protein
MTKANIIIAFLILVLLAPLGVIFSLPDYDKCKTCHQEKNTGKKEESNSWSIAPDYLCFIEGIDTHNGIIATWATLVIALFTATLWITSKSQLTELARQVDLARDEFLSTHRPKIRLKHMWLTKDIQPHDYIEVELNVVNIGNTPATLTEMKFTTVILPTAVPLPAIPAFYSGQAIQLNGELPSGITLRIPNISNNYKLSPEERNNILNGIERLYCVGYINYLDKKERLRVTSFCRYFEPPKSTYLHPFKAKDYGRFRIMKDPDYEYQD